MLHIFIIRLHMRSFDKHPYLLSAFWKKLRRVKKLLLKQNSWQIKKPFKPFSFPKNRFLIPKKTWLKGLGSLKISNYPMEERKNERTKKLQICSDISLETYEFFFDPCSCNLIQHSFSSILGAWLKHSFSILEVWFKHSFCSALIIQFKLFIVDFTNVKKWTII